MSVTPEIASRQDRAHLAGGDKCTRSIRWILSLALAVIVGIAAHASVTTEAFGASSERKPSGANKTACKESRKAAKNKRTRPKKRAKVQDLTNAQILTQSQNEFAARFHSLYLRDSCDKNFAFSPFSIHTALSMVYAGARGRTEKQIAKALQAKTMSQQQLHDAQRAQLQTLKGVNQEGVEFGAANALWVQNGFSVKSEFMNLLATDYGASPGVLDFKNRSEPSRKEINKWVSANTRDLIEELFMPGSINRLTRLVLVNAVAMNAEWLNKFTQKAIARTFHSPSGDIKVPMMLQRAKFGYKKRSSYSTIELPYKNDRLSMYVVLPARGAGYKFSSKLKSATLRQALKGVVRRDIRLKIPKFEITSKPELIPLLKKLGVRDAFTARADFSGIQKGLFISAAAHETVVKVNEEGTEAAAATGAGMGIISFAPLVVVNRPFLFLIKDRVTGAILFQGWVANPKK